VPVVDSVGGIDLRSPTASDERSQGCIQQSCVVGIRSETARFGEQLLIDRGAHSYPHAMKCGIGMPHSHRNVNEHRVGGDISLLAPALRGRWTAAHM